MIPEKYRKSSEAIATYNFTDVASGLGYETFYLFISENNAVTEYHMSNIQAYGNSATMTNTSGDFVTGAFNLPRVLKGDVYLDIYGSSQTAYTCSGSLYLTRDSTDTLIGTFIMDPITDATTQPRTAKLSVPATIIKSGDILKLHLGVGGNAANTLIFDPSGKWSQTATTKIHLPFKTNI